MNISNEELFAMMDDSEGCRVWTGTKSPKGYVLVEWPQSQDLMEEDWFEDECYLDASEQYDDCAYWVPQERLAEAG